VVLSLWALAPRLRAARRPGPIRPFLSWIRALDDAFDRSVDLFYSVAHEADALHLDELEAAGARHPSLRPHLVSTDRDPLLTADLALAGAPRGGDVWVYLCGPPPMMTALARGFRGRGVPASRVRWEQFDIR